MSQLGCLPFHLTCCLPVRTSHFQYGAFALLGSHCCFPGAGVMKQDQWCAMPASQSGAIDQKAHWFSLAAILQGKSSEGRESFVRNMRAKGHYRKSAHMRFLVSLGRGTGKFVFSKLKLVDIQPMLLASFFLLIMHLKKQPFCRCCRSGYWTLDCVCMLSS